MANIIITIGGNINDSLAKNDLVFYANLGAASGGFQSASEGDITYLGTVVSMDKTANAITVDTALTITSQQLVPTNKTMLFFSKNNKVNLSSVKGYYAEVKLQNTDTEKAELFSVGSEIALSSK